MNLTEQTWAEARELATRYPQSRSALLPMLHLVQSYEGAVTADGIALCADVLELSGGFVVQPQNVSTVSRPARYRHAYVQFCRNDPTGDSV